MRVLIAPDKFKGSLSALAAALAIQRGFLSVFPDAIVDVAPIADGGEGFANALCAALGGEWVKVPSLDAIGRDIEACYVWRESEKLAVIEMSEASGLWRLKPDERDPMRANTVGTGLVLKHAISRGARRVLIGLGGSATTDGGTGIAQALGFRFKSKFGSEFDPIPGTLDVLDRIERPANLVLPEIVAACDVRNPLLGERGTAFVYSPQKGASSEMVDLLDAAMRRLADVCAKSFGQDFRDTPGAGAAGGLGFGLLTFCGAKIRPGFDIVSETIKLEERIAAADIVLTGEGRLDDQTLDGKGPAGVAVAAHLARKKVIGFGGAVTADAERVGLFDAILPIADRPLPLDTAMSEAAMLLERAAARAARLLAIRM